MAQALVGWLQRWRSSVGKPLAWALAGLVALALPACAQPWADAGGRQGMAVVDDTRSDWVAQLAAAQGGVWLYDRDQGEWLSAQRDNLRNWPVSSGDRLRTDPGARSTLRVGALTLRLDGDSDLELLRLDAEQLAFRLWRGTLAMQVLDDGQARRTLLEGAEVQAMPQRAGHYRLAVDGNRTVATTWRGELRVAAVPGADDPLLVTAGRELALWRDTGTGAWRQTRRSTQPDGFAEWALAEGRLDQAPQAARHVSAEATGWQALDAHGQWRDDPQWGSLWVPRDVPPGWAPYRDGRWAWVAPWGWTWIDAAPWGFATYHYGQWVAWRGGWAWAPEPRHQRPVFRTVQPGWASPPPRADRPAYPPHPPGQGQRPPGPPPNKTVPTNPWPYPRGSYGHGPAAPSTSNAPPPRQPPAVETPSMPTPRVPGFPRRAPEPPAAAPTPAMPAPMPAPPVVAPVAPVVVPKPDMARPERPDRQDRPVRPRAEPPRPEAPKPETPRPVEGSRPADPAREQGPNKGERSEQPNKAWR